MDLACGPAEEVKVDGCQPGVFQVNANASSLPACTARITHSATTQCGGHRTGRLQNLVKEENRISANLQSAAW